MSAAVAATEAARPGYRAGRTLPLRVEAGAAAARRRTLVMGGGAGRPAVRPGHRLRDRRRPRRARQRPAHPDGHGDRVRRQLRRGLPVRLGGLPAGRPGRAVLRGHGRLARPSWSSLRYLLAAPVPRARLLWSQARRGARLQPGRDGAAAAGRARRRHGRVRLGAAGAPHRRRAGRPGTRVPSGSRSSVAYVFVSQLVTAGLAFWLSTKTDAPLGAVGGAVGLTIVGNVLDAVTALGDWRDFLPAHWQFAWADAVQPAPGVGRHDPGRGRLGDVRPGPVRAGLPGFPPQGRGVVSRSRRRSRAGPGRSRDVSDLPERGRPPPHMTNGGSPVTRWPAVWLR